MKTFLFAAVILGWVVALFGAAALIFVTHQEQARTTRTNKATQTLDQSRIDK